MSSVAITETAAWRIGDSFRFVRDLLSLVRVKTIRQVDLCEGGAFSI
jgi:hypothetical protein